MIGVRQIVAQVLTVEAVNLQIDALNLRFHTDVPKLPANQADPSQNGVQDLWARTYRTLTRPGIGYMVGILRSGRSELKRAGKNRMYIPMWMDIASEPTDVDRAMDQVSLIFQAALYVLEAAELANAALPNVSPPLTLVHINEPVGLEALVGDASASGNIVLVRSEWELWIDDARN